MFEAITTIEDLRSHYGEVLPTTWRKEISKINEPYRALIERAPFVAFATIGAEGMDCSPRGDGPGFVEILDDQTLAMPDRRGNNRLDTLRNIVEDPRVALLFLIPGWNECLRINGRAIVTADEDLRAQFEMKGVLPATVVVITIETMYFQCARALKRAALWSTDSQVKKGDLPSTGTLIQSAVEEFDGQSYDEGLEERQAKTLY